jgi:hypothetical protein
MAFVSVEQYAPKHRAAPVPMQPQALAGPRHVGQRARPARKALRTAITFGGLAVAATGVAVAAGVVHAPGSPVNLADALAPVAAAADPAPTTTDQAPSTTDQAPSTTSQAPRSADLSHRTVVVSRSSDRRETSDPAKAAALGLTTGPAVGGEENLSAQDPQDIAEALLPSYGWSSSEMSCLVPLWEGESGWRVNAENTSSGAYGIPQSLPGSKMATVGADWQTNPVTQIKWGLGYIQERYGSPCGAWGFKQGHGWY